MSPRSREHREASRFASFWLAFGLLFAACAAWAMATPLAGAPDEPAHIIRAAGVANGQLFPVGADDVGRGYFDIPAALSDARQWEDCFAHLPEQDASCQVIAGPRGGTERVSTTAGLYNPLYYATVGWVTLLGENPLTMVYSMRLLTAVGTALFGAAGFFMLATIMGTRAAAAVLAACATPMLLFLGGSVNPNAWEIAGGFALISAVLALGYRRNATASPVPALVLIAISGVVVSNMRGISPAWVGLLGILGLLSIPAATLASLFRRRATWVAVAALAAGVAVAAWWGLAAGAFVLEGDFANKDWTAGRVLESMLRRTLFEVGYVGLFGWTDTPAPLIAVVILGGLAVAFVAAGFWLATRRLTLTLTGAIVAWLLVPALVQLSYVRTAGMIWQARYTLVIYIGVIVIAAVAAHAGRRDRELPLPTRLTWIVGALVLLAHAYTFLAMQTRYARGSEGTIWMLFKEPLWSPPGGATLWFLLTCIAVGGFATFVALRPRSAEGGLVK